MPAAIASIPGVADVELLRGNLADATRPPDLLFEVAHGATRAADFDTLRARLVGDYDDDLREFFFVNTDVGAPELAIAMARRFVANRPRAQVLVVRCLVPRTFVDCNRALPRDAVAQASKPGELTPGLPPWVQAPADRDLLLGLHRAYHDLVDRAFAAVCGGGGHALCVHTYAPRSIDVPVDEAIVPALHRAYAADRIGKWPLRPAVDLICADPDGVDLGSPELLRHFEAELLAAGIEARRNGTYSLHPATLAHEFAVRHLGRTLCFEVRRDLLLEEFVPFVELHPDARAVERVALPMAAALLRVRS